MVKIDNTGGNRSSDSVGMGSEGVMHDYPLPLEQVANETKIHA